MALLALPEEVKKIFTRKSPLVLLSSLYVGHPTAQSLKKKTQCAVYENSKFEKGSSMQFFSGAALEMNGLNVDFTNQKKTSMPQRDDCHSQGKPPEFPLPT